MSIPHGSCQQRAERVLFNCQFNRRMKWVQWMQWMQ